MTNTFTRATASFAATALVASGLAFATSTPANAAISACVAANDTVTLLGFNDLHGRILTSGDGSARRPYTGIMPLATTIERIRATEGADNVAVLSVGDNIGASIFESMVTEDEVTLEALNSLGLEASAVGNHELDRGWTDLSDRVSEIADFPYLAANVEYNGEAPLPIEDYTIVTKAGLDIAIVGAVTKATPGLVSPDGIAGLTFSDEATAVNRVTDELLDGESANGEADIVVAAIHEGATDAMLEALDERIAAVFTGHTHATYIQHLPSGAPVVQAGSYGAKLAEVTLAVDTVSGGLCGAEATINEGLDAVDLTNGVVAEINTLVQAARDEADVVGQVVIGAAEDAISTPTGNSDVRNTESPMTNMVAQMFFEVVGDGDADNVIGIQNPGGTRDSFDAGDITYREAAQTLPFANSLFTIQLTGAQFKQVLEEQWQRGADGIEFEPPTEGFDRSILRVGLSDNVGYTYDSSLPLDQRVTSVSINGEPLDADKLYTLVSGEFLIGGGDQFYTFGEGVNKADAGRADLEAWVSWVNDQEVLAPDYSKRGVESALPSTHVLVEGGAGLTFTFSALDMELGEGDKVSPPLANTEIVAFIGDVEVGSGTVTDGVATITVTLPVGTEAPAGAQVLTFVVLDSGTIIDFPVTVELKAKPEPTPTPAPEFKRTAPYTLAGEHNINGRQWRTTCEPYSQTERCRTEIWASTIKIVDGKFVQTNGWAFNNLTYLPAKRSLWGDNPLANTGSWTAADGRQWKTECGTAATGRDGCRSYAMATVYKAVAGEKSGYVFSQSNEWVFNNIVMFAKN
ncbi:bifunctional metallophosphatase/5'-nucleotidase [Tessaracoccus sp. MC1865]|uniref:bifunctional metallophosphatase/5'-nucleotidase n=1 Tax=Tessaracoccus sp. MC1865 TaxID=2760310 RepID=UPI0015FF2699|nr:bifunctional UDP-sugar hydrolase/5'-nucleotidase [Tessaracoccus sp. MC1865]MBB1482855.1 bifunctional metallophosphatase/5'-nucleotidase [Tessaracoccus sp. MC1865]QTO37707.1 bifunctional metallophosphatase/5'-nucleotidase [Tessaracoccus sp. MC1865]